MIGQMSIGEKSPLCLNPATVVLMVGWPRPQHMERPRGTRDFGVSEMSRRLAFEDLLEEQARRSGFRRVATPVFESLELFTAKSGPGVVGQLYAFEDKGGRQLTLRPELTAPVMRAVANEFRQDPKPLRLSYFGPCYRYEEFKTGRYREFWQYGAELIGATGPIAEAEVLALAVSMLEASGLVDWEFKVGNVGILRAVLAALDISDVVSEGASESPMASVMRFLDKGDNEGLEAMMDSSKSEILNGLASLQGGPEVIDEARQLLSSISGIDLSALDDLATTLNALSSLAPTPPMLSVDLTVSRGLDYYTGMVFEAQVPELRGEGQVLGGGTYRLLHLFGLEELDPCCGFGLGFDRVLLALEKQAERLGRDEVVPDENSGPGAVVVIPFKVPVEEVLPLVSQMRSAGERAILELRSRKLGKSMSWADGIGAGHVIIIGPEDLQNGVCTIKRLSDGEQATPALDEVLEALQGLR
mgnify:CR=1 FL=1